MSVTMQPAIRYPFYMDTPRFRLPVPWSSVPYHFPVRPPRQQFHPTYQMPQQLAPVVYSQQTASIPTTIQQSPSYSNTRYDHLKKSTSYPNRRSVFRSLDVPAHSQRYLTYNEPVQTEEYRPTRTKSITDLHQMSEFTAAPLSKAHSWHAIAKHRRSNLSVAYATENHVSPKRRRKPSPQKWKKVHPPKHLPPPPPKRRASFKKPRKRPAPLPERGVVRISTLDEMPLPSHQTHNDNMNNDRSSMKGSISNSTTRRFKSKGNNSIKNRKIKNNNEVSAGIHPEASPDTRSSSSSNRSRSSLQLRLNGSLRNDPLISAAMEDLRQFRRSSSQNTLSVRPSRDLSRDSLRSESTFRSSISASPVSHTYSQSSFTSQERSEIRHIMKSIKTKDKRSSTTSVHSSPIPSSEPSIITNSLSSKSKSKPKKSCIAEELDREFSKLRARDPEQEITYVTPSSICKRKKTNEKSSPPIPPLPKFDELLRQVQLRPVNRSVRPILLPKEKTTIDVYENPLSPVPIPVAVPRSSPIPLEEPKIEESKHEYAIPMKKTDEKTLHQISHFQPMRNFSSTKPITHTIIPDKRPSRPLSMFNWFQNTSTNQNLSTFQPNRIYPHPSEHGTMSVNENIYTSDIEVYLPTPSINKNDDEALQIHLENQTIMTDEYFSDCEIQQTTNSSSALNDFFTFICSQK